MYRYSKYTKHILSFYREHLEFIDSLQTGFTGVASERPAPVFTNEVSVDTLYYGAFVNFSNLAALVRITALSPQYQWMANHDATPQDTPIHAIAATNAQFAIIQPLVTPFFVKAQGRLMHQFTNSAAAETTGGTWVWRALKLIDPIDGGWDYEKGWR
jgi:hypothetical protein